MAEPEVLTCEGTDADIPEVIDLLKSSLGEGAIPRTFQFWRWKHQESPFGRSPFWLARADGRLVGLRVFMRWRWQSGSEIAEAVRAVDTATHPDFQGKGIFRTLTLRGVDDLSRRNVDFVFNTPNAKSRPGYLKMGWSTVGRTSLWIAPRNVGALAHVVKERLGKGQVAATPDLEDGTRPSGAEVLSDPDVARLFASPSACGDDKYRTPRSAAFLDWRYVRCPACRYEFTPGRDRNVLVIHRARRRSGAKEVAISELFIDEESAGVREISGVLGRVLEGSKADYAVAAPPSSPRSTAALALAGFVPAPRLGPIMTVRPLALRRGLPNPLSRRSWAPAIGDLELF